MYHLMCFANDQRLPDLCAVENLSTLQSGTISNRTSFSPDETGEKLEEFDIGKSFAGAGSGSATENVRNQVDGIGNVYCTAAVGIAPSGRYGSRTTTENE